MISLCVRIGQVRLGYAKDAVSDFRLMRSGVAKLLPVIEPAASDYVIDRCKCPIRMIEVAMQHAVHYNSLNAREWRVVPSICRFKNTCVG